MNRPVYMPPFQRCHKHTTPALVPSAAAPCTASQSGAGHAGAKTLIHQCIGILSGGPRTLAGKTTQLAPRLNGRGRNGRTHLVAASGRVAATAQRLIAITVTPIPETITERTCSSSVVVTTWRLTDASISSWPARDPGSAPSLQSLVPTVADRRSRSARDAVTLATSTCAAMGLSVPIWTTGAPSATASVAGYYAATYLGEDLTRVETEERLDELLALELSPVTGAA